MTTKEQGVKNMKKYAPNRVEQPDKLIFLNGPKAGSMVPK